MQNIALFVSASILTPNNTYSTQISRGDINIHDDFFKEIMSVCPNTTVCDNQLIKVLRVYISPNGWTLIDGEAEGGFFYFEFNRPPSPLITLFANNEPWLFDGAVKCILSY